jgi:butyryl-CoA dehydrogenase
MAMVPAASRTRICGGGFLLEDCRSDEVFTPEDFTEQHTLIAQAAEEFARNEIVPNVDQMEEKNFSVVRKLLKRAGDLGLGAADVPEKYGGAEMDKVSSLIIADRLSPHGGFTATWSAHTCIGTLPLVYFGTEAQKKKYLPRLASGEMVGAYALSESSSASDSLNCRTRAQLSPDAKEYIVNGEKMWTTNASFADLFTVFAKVNGEKFTAFLIERTVSGLSVGVEEHKMGIRGSSTCPLVLNDCKVPVENVLGEIGKGHLIAFNVLNVGRLKLGAACVGAARYATEHAIAYARQRKAFGKVIADFGLIREKLANMAIGIFVGESMMYRIAGMLDRAITQLEDPGDVRQVRTVIDEYAIECSLMKVWGSELLDYVVDEMVQIYGGYGFVEEYPPERYYRDARINRIFEGTNEINRLIIPGLLLKRAKTGQLPLAPALEKLTHKLAGGTEEQIDVAGPWLALERLIATAKKLTLMVTDAAMQKYAEAIRERQEIMGAIADMAIETYAMESTLLRGEKMVCRNGEPASAHVTAMVRVYLNEAMERIESAARKIIAAATRGDRLQSYLSVLHRIPRHNLLDTIALREMIAQRVMEGVGT